MKRLVIMLFAACIILILNGCGGDYNDTGSVISDSSRIINAAPAAASTTEGVWKPYYTGTDDVNWYSEGEPWIWDRKGKAHRAGQSQALEAWQNLNGNDCKEPTTEKDYVGAYTNDSGSLTIWLYKPTLERAMYYGKRCKTGVWIIEAKYTRADIDTNLDKAVKKIKAWIKNHPDKSVNICGYGPDYGNDTVIIDITGYDCAEMEAELQFPDIVKLNYNHEQPDARRDEEIPEAPKSSVEVTDGVTFYMEQDTYPVNPAYVTVILDNKTNTVCDFNISQDYIEKYISGKWQKLEYPYAVVSDGYCALEYSHVIDTFSLDKYGYLGSGLYRILINTFDIGYGKPKYVEFALSKKAEALPYTLDKKMSIDKETRPDWEWYRTDELLKRFDSSGKYRLRTAQKGTGSAVVMSCVATGTESISGNGQLWYILGDRATGEAGLVLDKSIDALSYIDGNNTLWLVSADAFYTARIVNGKVSCTENAEPFPLKEFLESNRRTDYTVQNGVTTTEVYYQGLQNGYYTNRLNFDITPDFYSEGTTQIKPHIFSGYSSEYGDTEFKAHITVRMLTEKGWTEIKSDPGDIDMKMKHNDDKNLIITLGKPLTQGLYSLCLSNIQSDTDWKIKDKFSIEFYVS